MKEHRQFILAKGRYQVVALSQADEFDPEHIVAYEVRTTSGAWLRRELTLADASAWVEIFMQEEQQACRSSAIPADRPRRMRR